MPTDEPQGDENRAGAPVGALGRVVMRGVGYSSAGFFLTQALTLGAAIALARLISPEDFGIYASATILLGYAGMFVDSGMAAAVVQRGDRVPEAASTAFATNVVSGLALALLALAAAPLLGRFFGDGTIEAVAAVMAGVVVLDALILVPDAILQREFSFVRRLFVSPSAALTFGVVAGVAAAEGLGVWALVIGRYAGSLVEIAVIWALVRWRPHPSLVSFAMWRDLARFGRHIFAAALLTQTRNVIRTALLGRFVSVAAVGQYRYAETLTNLPRTTWVVSSAYVLFPAFARLAGEPLRLRAAFLRTMRWMGIVLLPASAILLPLGPAIIVCLLGEVWRPAGYAVMALVAVPICGGVVSVISEAVKGAGRPGVISRAALVGAIAAPVLFVAFLPLGLVGIAAAGSLASLVTTGYVVRAGGRALGVEARAMAGALRASAIASLVMVAVLFPLEWLVVQADSRGTAAGIALLIVEGLVGLAVYLAVLRWADPPAVRSIAAGARGGIHRLRARRGLREAAGG